MDQKFQKAVHMVYEGPLIQKMSFERKIKMTPLSPIVPLHKLCYVISKHILTYITLIEAE